MNIKVDSRKVEPGDTFIALRGISSDGHSYIDKAIENGATKIIAEEGSYSVETMIVKDTREYLINYLKENYYPLIKDIKMIALTGTNGKTTSCYLIYQLLNKLGLKTAYIGTIGFYLDGEIKELENTTPDILDLYEMFLQCKEKGIEAIVMEVSSHAIGCKRVAGLEYDIACFTNLTQDHLDYHKTMENYKNAKIELFRMLRGNRVAIINGDDPYYKDFMLEENNNIVYGLNGKDYKITNYELHIDRTNFTIENDGKSYDIEISLPGKYNIYNYLNAFITALNLGYDIETVINISKTLTAPSGRFDLIKHKNSAIIIDYAHTPDAMENIINNVNEYKKGRVITIIGCGGDRDRTKRPIMGRIATTMCDYAIFTNDNPRTEDEKQIMDDIVNGLENTNYEIIYDRKEAIKKGVSLLQDNDILLVLGKGHEEYQIIGKEKIHLSDKKTVLEAINEK